MKIILSLLFLNFYIPFQQTYLLMGNLRDTNGQSVSNVRVSVTDDNYQLIRSVLVDSSGRFQVNGLRAGVYIIRIETTGTIYEEQTQRVELFSGRRSGGHAEEAYPVEFVLKLKKGKHSPVTSSTVFAQSVPQEARNEYERAVKSSKANKPDQAIAALKKAIGLFPEYYDALEMMGIEYVKAGQYTEALPLLTQAIQINKSGTRSLYGIGVAYLNLNRLREAIEQLEACAQLNANNPNTYMMLGLAYGNSRIPEKAVAAFQKALQIGGAEAAEAYFYLAGLYNKQGQYRKAWQALEAFLRASRNVKDPAQVKVMIEKLKEKEKTKPIPEQEAQAPTTSGAGNEQQAPLSVPATSSGQPAVPETTEMPPLTGAPAVPENKIVEPPPLPPLPAEFVELLKQSEIAGGIIHKQLFDYTYQLKKTKRVLDEHGKSSNVQEQVYEAYPVRGEHVLIRLSTDGRESRTLAEDRKRAATLLAENEAQQAKEEKSVNEKYDYVSAGISGTSNGNVKEVGINISMFLRFCDFYSPRIETQMDRTLIALSFRPRFGINVPTKYSYLTKLVGTIWIDQDDKIVTRLEAWPSSAFELISSAATSNEAVLIYQQERQSNGAWFPNMIRLNARGRTDLFNGLNWDVLFEFSNYRRFNTTATEKLNDAPPRKN